MQLAEDVVQDTFLHAIENWKVHGIPNKPAAWLFTVARNKATDVIRKQKRDKQYADALPVLLQSEYSLTPTIYQLVNSNTLKDDWLRMMFVCCHTSLSAEASVTLILKTFCGLTVTEIAKAFVTGYDVIEKRLYRARQTFRDNKVAFELPAIHDLPVRLERVLLCIYLLFNEGYNATQHNSLVRKELMQEAMQLCTFVCSSPALPHEEAHALLALMCFTAARNDARLDNEGNILLLKQQDRSKWNYQLIQTGTEHLEMAASCTHITKYHLEAGIAYEHAKARRYEHTDWQHIITCYDLLFRLQRNPVVALNRAIAIGELHGATAGLQAIENLEGAAFLKDYYLLPATLGELHLRLKQHDKAKIYFEKAAKLTKSAAEKQLLQNKIDSLDTG